LFGCLCLPPTDRPSTISTALAHVIATSTTNCISRVSGVASWFSLALLSYAFMSVAVSCRPTGKATKGAITPRDDS
jgi:hypothetical protein